MNTMAGTGTTATNTPNPHVLEVIRLAEQESTGLLRQRQMFFEEITPGKPIVLRNIGMRRKLSAEVLPRRQENRNEGQDG